jgi:hypothetical protein
MIAASAAALIEVVLNFVRLTLTAKRQVAVGNHRTHRGEHAQLIDERLAGRST